MGCIHDNNVRILMDIRLTYDNNHTIWTDIDPSSELLNIEFGYIWMVLYYNTHRHVFNSDEYLPTLGNKDVEWMMIHKNNHRIRMRLGQHLVCGSAHIYFGLILTHNNKHRTWMGIDVHLLVSNLDDYRVYLGSTSTNNELKRVPNPNWHAWIRVVLNAV